MLRQSTSPAAPRSKDQQCNDPKKMHVLPLWPHLLTMQCATARSRAWGDSCGSMAAASVMIRSGSVPATSRAATSQAVCYKVSSCEGNSNPASQQDDDSSCTPAAAAWAFCAHCPRTSRLSGSFKRKTSSAFIALSDETIEHQLLTW